MSKDGLLLQWNGLGLGMIYMIMQHAALEGWDLKFKTIYLKFFNWNTKPVN
jgi:hypothetical protein